MAGRVIGTATVQVKADTSGFTGALKGIGSGLAGMGSRLKGAFGALGVGDLASDAVKMGGTYRVQMDNARAAIDGLVKSQGDADKLMKEMTSFAISTPFDLPGVQNVTTRLLAVGEGFGVTKDNVLDYAKTLGDAAAINGKGADSMLNVVNVMGRMSGQGRVMTRDMNQLTANFPSLHPWEVMSEMTGKTEGQLRKLATKPGGLSGIVETGDFIDALNKKMQEMPGAAGAMERKMGTLGGAMELFKDSIGVALADGLQPFFTALQTGMNAGAITEGLGGVIKIFSELATMLVQEILPLVPDFINTFTGLLEAIKPAMPLVGALFKAFSLGLKELTPVISIIAKLAGWIAKLLSALDPAVLGGIAAALIVLWTVGFGPVGIVAAAITGLAMVIIHNWDAIKKATKIVVDALVAAWEWVWTRIEPVVDTIVEGFWKMIHGITAAWDWLFDNVLQPIGEFVMGIIHFFQTLYDTLVGNSIVPDLVNSIIDFFLSLPMKILDALASLVEWVVGVFVDLAEGVLGALGDFLTMLGDFFSEIPGKIVEWVVAGAQFVHDLGKDIIEWIIVGIYDVENKIWDWIKALPRTLWDKIQSFASKVWDIGKDIVKWILVGVYEIESTIWDWVKALPGVLWNKIQEFASRVWDIGKDIINWILVGVYELEHKIWDWLTDLPGTLWDKIQSFGSKLVDIGKKFISWIIEGIKSTPGSIFGALVDQIPGIGNLKQGFEMVFNARGGVITEPTLSWLGERGRPEAVIPLTNPGRAMQLMQQTGLDRLAVQMGGGDRGFGGGPLITMPGAVIQDATDADLVAQRTLIAIQAAMVA